MEAPAACGDASIISMKVVSRCLAIIKYPRLIDAGSVSDQAVTGMDLFVTLAGLGGAGVPADRPIDGAQHRSGVPGRAVGKPGYVLGNTDGHGY